MKISPSDATKKTLKKTEPEKFWTAGERIFLNTLDSPWKIQEYLDSIEYNSTTESNSPRYVIKKKRAHCFEGALFAAACLENLGFHPLVLDLQAVNDDDHVIAVFKIDNCWGAIAKSNFTTLRYREPVYRNLRELAMSYFDFYFNTLGDKSLRGYSMPHNLCRFDHMEWRTTENDLEDIGYYLDKVRHIPLISENRLAGLEKAGKLLLESSLMGANPEGLFVPEGKRS